MIPGSQYPAPIVLFGSGETLPSSGKAHEKIASLVGEHARIAILETPAGFEPNSEKVAANVGDFLLKRLQNYSLTTTIVPARKKGTEYSPDREDILEPVLVADWIFMGPGSPTYAVRQLRDSLALRYLVAKHRLGTPITLASAAILAMSAYTLPVYEIYKVGAELHWLEGINFLEPYGLNLIFIPHWNNTDGGSELDTSRCYMGEARYLELLHLLPPGLTLVGIDEHTSLMIDFSREVCEIFGVGSVTISRQDRVQTFRSGDNFTFDLLGSYRLPEPNQIIERELLDKIRVATESKVQEISPLSNEIQALVRDREEARTRKDWETADKLRDLIRQAGWQVQDTPDGMRLVPADE